MKKIFFNIVCVLCCGIAEAQLLYSTKFESQPVGTAYTRPVWTSDGFVTGSWDGFLDKRTAIDDKYSYSGEKSLRVSYPKGCYGNSTNGTGAQVDLKFDARDEAYMSYWIRFSDDFSWGTTSEGGKLPGLGSGNTSGDKVSDGTNGFTARFMWRTGGRLVVLLYHMDFTSTMGEDVELFYPDGSPVIATRGEWHHIVERVKTNSVSGGKANPDGELQVWFDGQQVLLRKGLRFRVNNDGIDELYFSTFHGGGDASWAPTVDSYIWFDDIRIGTTYESVAMQTCQNPQLGTDKALCGAKSINIETNYSNAQIPYVTWYKDGSKIGSKTKSITAQSAGLYSAYYDSAWCAQKSSITVHDNIKVDLGEDQYICSSSFATLESNVDGDSYLWKKDGTSLTETTKSIRVKDAGTYSLTVKQTGCSDASDNVKITSGALSFADYSGDAGSTVTIASPTGGNIHWYENPSSSPVATGKAYNATLAAGETYIYASDADKFEGTVGKSGIVSGKTWHKNDYTMKLKFIVYKELTIDEITVYPYASQNITINIVNASNSAKVFTKTFTGVQGGETTLNLNATLPAGTYYMDGDGSTGELLMSHDGDSEIAYPYTIDNLISITSSYYWNKEQTGYYMYFYNFKVSTGNTCAAAPIKLTGIRNGDYPISTDFESQIVGEPLNRAKWESEGFKYAWGSDASFPVRSEIVDEVSVSGNNSLKITYPKGEVGPSGGGAQALFTIPNRAEIYSSYYVRFSEDFSWGGTNKEGKLPGICGMGGWDVCDGGKACDGTNGFSARPIWYGDGNLMLYLYDMDKTGVYGVNYPLKDANGNQVAIQKGEWIHIAERVKINTVTNGVANPDGEVEFWINGVPALSISGYRFITTDDQINVFYFDTFMGGSGSAYAPANTCYTWFDDMIISDVYDDVKFKGQIAPQTYTVTFVDWDNMVLSTQTIEKGKNAVAPTEPTRSGYTFAGWEGDFTNVTANVTIVATYTENTLEIPDADVTIVIDAEKDNIAISPYMYSMNSMMQYADRQKLAKDAGIRMSRQNMGNNSTLYNWRRKLTVHPDWYNNVYAEDWDTTAQSMAEKFSDIQGMFGFQLIGRAASTTEYNFPDWQYNKSVRWDGCGKNLCGNGSSVGNYNTTDDGDVNLYTEKWTPDSTTGIIPHWQNDLNLDLSQFQYWNMDNEAEIWAGTHDAVFPNPTSEMLEIYLQNYFETVKLARKLYPNIKICGPVAAHEWSWYFPSGAGQPVYNGKKYNWLEYFIMRCAQEEKASGVKMIDVFDIHNYPEVTNVEDILQTHRIYWDTGYDYPGANGVKGVKGNWDNSVTKEMVLVRCQEWFDTYFGPNYEVTYGTSEYNVKTNVPMLTALAYAGNLGEGARHGMEFFIPWDWRVGMWETVHLFSRYAKKLNVSAVSSDEAMISAYSSINTVKDSLTIIFVNRNASGTQSVATSIANFNCPDGEYDALQLSDLPTTETFVSHANNALKSKQVSVKNGVFSIELPAYSITAVMLHAPEIEAEEFTVSFVVDEKIVSEQTVLKGEDAEAPENPTKIGYDFVEWDTDFTNVSKDLRVSAVFVKHQYTVLFVDWDGTKIDEQKVAFGDDAVAPKEPTRENYEFAGWSGSFTNISEDITITATYTEIGKADYSALNEAIAKAEALETISYTKATVDALNNALNAAKAIDTNLYATDQSIVDDATAALISAMNGLMTQTFVVTFIADGKIVSEQTVEYGQSAKMPDNPTKVGYDFVEWDVDYSNVTKELSITAVFVKHQYTVLFVDWDGTKIDEQKVAFGDDAVAPKEPTRENYEFAGWSGIYTNISEDVIITATYIEKGHAKYTALDNAIAEAELLTDEKYLESTWNALQMALNEAKLVERDLLEESQSIIDNATKNLTDALANLAVKTFTVVFISDGKTISTQTIPYGESAEMPEKPQKEGYKFVKWDIDYSAVTDDMTITAVYEILTFTVIFKDYNGKELSKQTINYGEPAIAPVEPARDGFTFVSWDADFSKITADLIITAMYKEKTKASYTVLDKTIASAIGLQEAKYSTSSWSALQSALLEAKNIDRNLYIDSQSIIDAANKTLQEAINALVQLDKTMLASTIETAQSTITKNDGNIGDEIGQYPQSAVVILQSAISASQQVYSNAQTQEELNNQTASLNKAIQAFLQSKNKKIVDVSTLSALVAQANDLLHNNTAGNRPGQVGLLEYMDLFVARNGGEVLLQQIEPATESIYAQVTRLEMAIEAFLNAYIPLAVDQVESDAVEVYATNRSIFVKNAENKEIVIFDNLGRMLCHPTMIDDNGEKEYFVGKIGIYHVLVNNASYSVVVK